MKILHFSTLLRCKERPGLHQYKLLTKKHKVTAAHTGAHLTTC